MKSIIFVVFWWFLFHSTDLCGQIKAPSPIGKLVDAGGHMLHLNETGRGEPTVILENGSGDFSFIWYFVQRGVSKFAKVVSYDRAGYAWSGPGPLPRSSRQSAFELHTALQNAGLTGPYILVGQSFGGFLVRAFARQYPSEVVGMVLVDALNEDSRVGVGGGKFMRIREFAKGRIAPLPQTMIDSAPFLSDEAMTINTKIDPPLDRLPKKIQQLQVWAQSQGTVKKAVASEMDWSPEDVADMFVNRAKKEYRLGNMPLIVLSRGNGGYQGADAPELENERLFLQKELSQLSSNGKHIIVTKSGHNIHMDDPDAVVDAIKEVIEAVLSQKQLQK